VAGTALALIGLLDDRSSLSVAVRLVTINGSGNSPNIVAALKARENRDSRL
jgi:hypothetical protein